MDQILLVEDNNFFGSKLVKRIEEELNLTTKWCKDYKSTKELIEEKKENFFMALLDLNLPDAPNGEIIDFVLKQGIPSVVFTGVFGDEVREQIWSKGIIDYILKEGPQNIDYIISLIKRIRLNRSLKVLIVDDSAVFRKHLYELLKIHQYIVFQAHDGKEAVSILNKNPDVKLILTDYNMPNMDGFELTKNVRYKYSKEQLAIIGLSAQENNLLSARFIKNGANDFINKPFLSEEFYCRITQNIEMIEHIEQIQISLNKDYLTDLYSRRYFFEVGRELFIKAREEKNSITVAMIDIDFFKNINDTYGHDVGDDVLRHLADILKIRFKDNDIVSRFGGEEFCILSFNMDPPYALAFFDDLRRYIEDTVVQSSKEEVKFTVSIGICTVVHETLDEMIKQADMKLYKAKQTGRNKVMVLTQ